MDEFNISKKIVDDLLYSGQLYKGAIVTEQPTLFENKKKSSKTKKSTNKKSSKKKTTKGKK